MFSDYVPYIMIGLIVLFVCSCIYVYKHRAEVIEMAGIEPPNVPGFQTEKHVKKPKGPRPNAKKAAKIMPQHQAQAIAEEEAKNRPKQDPKKQARQENKKVNIIRRNKGRSDLPLNTNESALKSMSINNEGFLCAVSKDRIFHLYYTDFFNISPTMLTQQFELDKFEITNAAFVRSEGLKVVYTENAHKKLIIANLKLDDESKFVIDSRNEIENVYKSACNAIIVHPEAKYIALHLDNNKIVFYNMQLQEIGKISFEGKKINHVVPSHDYNRLFIAVGASIEVFDWSKTEWKQFCTVPTKAVVTAMAFCAKTGELVVATADGLLTVYTYKIQQNKARNVWEIQGIRLLTASVFSASLAIVSGKGKLTIVDLKDGKVSGALNEMHEGEVNFLQFSNDDAWIFVGSRSKPNIESYRFADKK
ncbi:hypothetical protein TVAG_128910 [Trichomonas vaginalis G3]|uniref:Anaphase-promoting complex subunit 4 WD40 domain-containing protein n=1 Tax=Trichomonas vaginalis (strain ATCC PRA-98 / G3) TaxID=412133 RepID=A2E4E2_TRIV3|nr:transducin beta-like protein 2 family [Trichomonas vaginalis G3]EAY12477.1 hypothetical protein TVAG_128910 [Trichomonas vaginalis G3]KAI5539540.1 transducin beta-like protein 2 family [Trichomonas vaginalis G3]|eukprot:XP_001324700.1 hypothetical protein [Trichomonas vaginalis G3]